jgi:hypothetical protein
MIDYSSTHPLLNKSGILIIIFIQRSMITSLMSSVRNRAKPSLATTVLPFPPLGRTRLVTTLMPNDTDYELFCHLEGKKSLFLSMFHPPPPSTD